MTKWSCSFSFSVLPWTRRQVGKAFAEETGQLIDGDQTIGLVAFLVGLALEPFEQDGGEQAVILQIQRGGQAVGCQERDPAGLRQVILGAVVAQELLVRRLAQGWFRDGAALAVIDEALEIDVKEDGEMLALELLERVLDLIGGNRVFAPALEGRVGEEIATAIAGFTQRTAVADEGEQHQVGGFGFINDPFEGLEEIGAGGFLAVIVRLAQQQPDIFGVGAEVFLVAEHLLQGFDVGLGVGARLDLLVGVFADSDKHHEGLRRLLGGRNLAGLIGPDRMGQRRTAKRPSQQSTRQRLGHTDRSFPDEVRGYWASRPGRPRHHSSVGYSGAGRPRKSNTATSGAGQSEG